MIEKILGSAHNIMRPRVLIIYYSGKHRSFRAFGGDMFQSKLVELAGGISVSAHLTGKKNIDVEQVAKLNPDIILIIRYVMLGSKVKKMIMSDPAWRNIKPVREGRVYVIPYDGENWIDPCLKWILGLYWMAKLFHPSLFRNINITSIADNFSMRSSSL